MKGSASTAKLFKVLWSFLPFFALMIVAFGAVFLLHRSYKRRLEIAANREAKQQQRQQQQQIYRRANHDNDDNDNDDDDNDNDDDDRTAKQHQHRAEKKRMKELKRAYREQLQEQRDRALDEADYNDDPRAVFRAAELRAAQVSRGSQLPHSHSHVLIFIGFSICSRERNRSFSSCCAFCRRICNAVEKGTDRSSDSACGRCHSSISIDYYR
jgi:hypothetical protein